MTAPTWRPMDLKRARAALDGYGLDLRERVSRGDWRVAWRELVLVHGATKIRALLLEHCEIEVARCREWHTSGEESLARVRADRDAVVARRGRPDSTEDGRVRYHERSQAKYAARIRAAERLRELATGELSPEILNYYPLGAPYVQSTSVSGV